MISTQSVEDAAVAVARAEYALWNAVITEIEHEENEIRLDRSTTPMYRYQAERAVRLDIAQRLHVGEQSVWRMFESGTRLRDRAPVVWAAFAAGGFTAAKAHVIAAGIERCQQPETVTVIERSVVSFAESHTVGELKRWLNQLIDKLEPPTTDECDAEREKRRVEIIHGDNGMSLVSAYVTTIAATAISTRFRQAAKTLTDDRTRDQKQADLFVSWLTNATGTETDVHATINVVVEAEALAGVTDTPARIDDDTSTPLPWILELAESDNTLWNQLLVDRSGHVLDVTHLGYQPPAVLREAIQLRDLRCRVNGCDAKAEHADLDHKIPYDSGGETAGDNLWCLCRRHHRMKGHGLLPKSAFGPPAVHITRLYAPPFNLDYIPAA